MSNNNNNDDGSIVSGLFKEISSFGAKIGGFMVVVTAIFWLATPVLKPYLELPEQVQLIQFQINNNVPELIQIRGIPVPSKTVVSSGEFIDLTLFTRRAAACETTIRERFWNIEEKKYYFGRTLDAQKSPVTKSFNMFTVSNILIPELPDGKYQIHNLIKPIKCGVYTELSIQPSLPFEVKN